jgi:preprotein translocase subunit SecG
MTQFLLISQILVASALIVVISLQARGSGFSGTFSQDTSISRTRRGLDRTLFQATIVLGVLFILVSLAGAVIPARL